MPLLTDWLEAHREQLIVTAIQKLSSRKVFQQQAEGPVRWFFESLVEAIAHDKRERLETLLRNWVNLCSIPINGEPVGVFPVLGALKKAIWEVFLADPPPESALELAARLDGVLADAAEFLARVEASALFEALSHQVIARQQLSTDRVEQVKGSFVSVAAHELKTPLTVIEGYANMLRLELLDGEGSRAAMMVKGIQSGLSRMRELIEDLIDVSLIEIGLLTVDLQPVWLRRLLDIIEVEAGPALRARKVTLVIERDTLPGKPTIGDPERLMKAVGKIVANAIKFTPDGGTITISARSLNGFIDITVKDTGIGIAPANLERIFEKFSALGDVSRHSSGKVKFKGGGPGLGLMIAKGIIEAHGGTIWAESAGFDEETCPGSCFHIMLPMRDVTTGEGMAPLVAAAAGSLAGSVAHTQAAGSDSQEKPTPVSSATATSEVVTAGAGSAEQRAQEDTQPGESFDTEAKRQNTNGTEDNQEQPLTEKTEQADDRFDRPNS